MNNDSIDKKPDNTGDQKNGYDQAQKSDKKPPKLNSIFEDDKKPKKGGPKFNLYWIYALIGVALLSANFLRMSPELYDVVEKDFNY